MNSVDELNIYKNKNNFLVKVLAVASSVGIIVALSSALYFNNFAFASTEWNDSNAMQTQQFGDIYNDGSLQVTEKITALVSEATEKIKVKDTIIFTNLTSNKISIDKVSILKYEGFEDVNIGNWKISNDTETVFNGGASTEYLPNISIESGQKKEFNVESDLQGQVPIALVNTTPFKFNYLYTEIEEPSNYYYAVTIWGINQDDDNAITFGPATGEDERCLNVNGHHEHCIHNDSWAQIITNIKEGHSDWYDGCLNYGCTKDVPLTNNTKIMNYPSHFTRCSNLYEYIKGKGRYYEDSGLCFTCFNNYCQKVDDCEVANWCSSWMRATLNGYNNSWDPFTLSKYATKDHSGNVYEACTEDDCLLSSFPKVLKDAIMPKKYSVPTKWDNNEILQSKEIKDKLWLPSCTEIYGTLSGYQLSTYYLNDYGQQYQKFINSGDYWGNVPIDTYAVNTIKEKDTSTFYGRIGLWRLRTSVKNTIGIPDPGVFVMNYNYVAGYFSVDNIEEDVGSGESGLCPCFILGNNND